MMPLPQNPLTCIVPVLMTSDIQGPPYSILGTGFFIDDGGTFLTAGHVFRDNALSEGRAYAVAILPGGPTVYGVEKVRYSAEFDIAMGQADRAAPTNFLSIGDANAAMNSDVLTVEFSATRSRVRADGRSELLLTDNYHKGNVVSYEKADLPQLEGAEILELSFPALRGASGAPVIVEQSGRVVGMVLANLERHLLPAHVEKIEGKSGEPTETRYYFLPRAYAISWLHLREFVDSQQGPGP